MIKDGSSAGFSCRRGLRVCVRVMCDKCRISGWLLLSAKVRLIGPCSWARRRVKCVAHCQQADLFVVSWGCGVGTGCKSSRDRCRLLVPGNGAPHLLQTTKLWPNHPIWKSLPFASRPLFWKGYFWKNERRQEMPLKGLHFRRVVTCLIRMQTSTYCKRIRMSHLAVCSPRQP